VPAITIAALRDAPKLGDTTRIKEPEPAAGKPEGTIQLGRLEIDQKHDAVV
jgi:hypothetical protein